MSQLVHWLDYQGIFSIEDNVVEDHTESWCVAKIDRLVGALGPPVQRPMYESEFYVAGGMSTGMCIDPGTDEPVPYSHVGPPRQEVKSLL